MSEALQQHIETLGKFTRGLVDLRYRPYGDTWCVMVACGNIMRVVPGSICDDPIHSITNAISRWENRSEDAPFL